MSPTNRMTRPLSRITGGGPDSHGRPMAERAGRRHRRRKDIRISTAEASRWQRLVVEKIDADPGLFRIGHENLQRWSRVREGGLPPCREEWKELLKRPWSQIREILLDESDEGQRLRSSHPFAGLVSEKERRRIHDAHRA